jgi:hypothetical protein
MRLQLLSHGARYQDSRGRFIFIPLSIGRGLGASDLVSQLASAITRQENANPAWNNPGALRAGPGMIGTAANGIAIFPDFATGEAALERQIQLNINRGLTLQEFFAGKPGVYGGYAPAADSNRPYEYAANVAGWAGIDSTVPLNQLASGASGSWDAADVFGGDWTSWLPWVLGAGLLGLVAWEMS